MGYLWVFLGAGLGGALRQAASLLALRLSGAGLPSVTPAMGALTERFALRGAMSAPLRLFQVSAESGKLLVTAAYLGASIGLSAVMLSLAMGLVRSLLTAG